MIFVWFPEMEYDPIMDGHADPCGRVDGVKKCILSLNYSLLYFTKIN